AGGSGRCCRHRPGSAVRPPGTAGTRIGPTTTGSPQRRTPGCTPRCRRRCAHDPSLGRRCHRGWAAFGVGHEVVHVDLLGLIAPDRPGVLEVADQLLAYYLPSTLMTGRPKSSKVATHSRMLTNCRSHTGPSNYVRVSRSRPSRYRAAQIDRTSEGTRQ